MSGREFDSDGTDTFHREHPWEQTTHPKYVQPSRRSREDWPPVPAVPHGPAEAERWENLPEHAPEPPAWQRTFGVRWVAGPVTRSGRDVKVRHACGNRLSWD